ncbi:hypothetical protein [Oricola indica]|uniref:hypothetical protein n=1 Tax=Oricola indica TaxID=2872591 RepID=UPI003CCB7656
MGISYGYRLCVIAWRLSRCNGQTVTLNKQRAGCNVHEDDADGNHSDEIQPNHLENGLFQTGSEQTAPALLAQDSIVTTLASNKTARDEEAKPCHQEQQAKEWYPGC